MASWTESDACPIYTDAILGGFMHLSGFLKRAVLCGGVALTMSPLAHAEFPAGSYSGTYLGADHGTINITVDSYGAVTCRMASDTGKGTVTGTGGVFSVDPPLFDCRNIDSNNYISVDGSYEAGGINGQYLFRGLGGTTYSGHYSATPSGAGGTSPLSWKSLSGLWYDPAYDSTGFNILGGDNGLIFTYYGRNAQGGPLWTISMDALGGTIVPNTEYTIALGMITAGTFANPVNQMARWGQVSVKFSDCTRATATLSGNDGVQVLNLQRLSGVKDASGC
ncbi:hypothetical protein [Diaphorobacter caeni]|uniref:hypothetical protein n=1 Tax=Diaphorobacter caeni TaxID=2784387 RepID=UPI00188ECDE0|nr:hypothetical protein [Diaphorobacter caeni]MBF5005475.1 hypothetical protein [Diaphorobacter caeni]